MGPVHRRLFKAGILGIENVGGDLDTVTGKRVTFAFFPWNWDRGDSCIIRLVAMTDPTQLQAQMAAGGVADIISNRARVDPASTGRPRRLLPAELVYLSDVLADMLVLTEVTS